MKNNRALKLEKELIKKHKLSTKSPPPDSLFWRMWNHNLPIAKSTLKTKFIQGIKKGNLDPVLYGAFNVSDAYYCFNGAGDYKIGAAKASDPELKYFLLEKYKSYVSFNKSFPKTWHVKDANGIKPIPVCRRYSAFETKTVNKEDSIYALIVMLPCEYLWAWLGGQLSPAQKGNLYGPWIKGNTNPSGGFAMGNFIEQYQKRHSINEKKAVQIYSKAMNYEYQNFLAAVA